MITVNAADESKVKEQANKLRRGRELEINDMKFLLSTIEGRRTFWRLLSHCKSFGSVFNLTNEIFYNSGKQDVGHYIMAEITEANEDAFFQMMKEAKEGSI